MNTIELEVPNAEDYRIDDFLSNCLQYKIDGEWIYDTNLKLPTSILTIEEVKKINGRTWLILKT